jgi:hypothetical protein
MSTDNKPDEQLSSTPKQGHDTDESEADTVGDCASDDPSRLSMDRECVTLDATVDVSGTDVETQQVIREMARIFEQQFETFVARNLDYGSSFLRTGESVEQYDGGPFTDAKRANLYGLFTRTGDKRNRFYHQVFADGVNASDESVAETAMDAATYWTLVAWVVQHYQTSSEFEEPPYPTE